MCECEESNKFFFSEAMRSVSRHVLPDFLFLNASFQPHDTGKKLSALVTAQIWQVCWCLPDKLYRRVRFTPLIKAICVFISSSLVCSLPGSSPCLLSARKLSVNEIVTKFISEVNTCSNHKDNETKANEGVLQSNSFADSTEISSISHETPE